MPSQTQEEWINISRGQQLHLGRKNLVLNGPIDNPRGSCTSCHGFAQIARVTGASPGLPFAPPVLIASAASLDKYFTNIKAATPLQLGMTRAINNPTANVTLPPGLNTADRGAGHPRPVATRLEEVIRDQK